MQQNDNIRQDPIEPRFQVLALDGGGAKGIFSAAVLAHLEEDLGGRLIDRFDLVVGTSTGGIIAAALAAGLSPRDIVSEYESLIPKVFPDAPVNWRPLTHLFRRKYSSEVLRRRTRQLLGDITLEELPHRLILPTWDLQASNVRVLKTPHHPNFRVDGRLSLWEAVMATTAAPTYFEAAHIEHQHLVDGGVWANNPSLVGLTEAASVFGIPLGGIRVLNIGTTTALNQRPNRLHRGGFLQWARHAHSVILEAQERSTENQVGLLLGERFVRVDRPVPAGQFNLDQVDGGSLQGLARAASQNALTEVERIFWNHEVPPFEPAGVQGAGS